MVDSPAGSITRRDLLRMTVVLGLGAASFMLPGCGAGAGETAASTAAKFSVFVWAGSLSKLVDQYARKPYDKSHPGADVGFEIGTNATVYPKMIAARQHPSIIGGMFNDVYGQRGIMDDLWTKFDPKFIPNAANVIPDLNPAGGYGITFSAYPFALAYNPHAIPKPTSWLDLWNPKYRGKVVMQEGFYDTFVMTAKILGHDPNDVEAGIRAWVKHKDQVGAWVPSPSRVTELLDSGNGWIAPYWGPWALAAAKGGKKIAFTIPKEGATQQSAIIQLSRGFSKTETDLAQQFFNIWLSPAFQKAQADVAFFGPAIRGIEVPTNLKGQVLTAEEAQKILLRYDYKRMAQNLDKYRALVDRLLK